MNSSSEKPQTESAEKRGASVAESAGKRGPSAPSISLPKGGGAIRGIGEKFAANPVTGTGSMSVPVYLTPGRSGFSPQLSLSYDSGSGNGLFGMGWRLSLPSITRKTDKGLPRYSDGGESDVFILSDAEDLVPAFQFEGGTWRPDVPEDDYGQNTYSIKRYRPRTEGLFARIERWTENATGISHWRVVSKDNITSLYGLTGNSRISDPASSVPHIFSWLISMSFDARGNVIYYEYKSEDPKNVPATTDEKNRSDLSRSANRYIKHIRYGNQTPFANPPLVPAMNIPTSDFLFEAVFDYGEHDPDDPLPGDDAASDWPCRPDPFSTYRPGFEIRAYRLCRRILMFHHFPSETGVGNNCLVRSTDISYSNPPSGSANYSFVSSITQRGRKRKSGGGYAEKSFPALDFTYSKPEIGAEVKETNPGEFEGIRFSRENVAAEWVDLYGEGTTGVLVRSENGWYYKRNSSPRTIGPEVVGTTSFDPVTPLGRFPALASAKQLQVMDLAGDGRPDLVSLGSPVSGFYEISEEETIERFRTLKTVPNIDWNDSNLKFIDLTGDGHADICITDSHAFTWYPSEEERGFGRARSIQAALDEEKGPKVLFADAENAIFLADMTGDGLSDIVRIRNGSVCYWPNLGYGRFGAKVTMSHSPVFDGIDRFDRRRILLADIDGTGTADIIYLSGAAVRIYFNNSGNGWSDAVEITNFPPVDSTTFVTTVDLLGDGTACLIWGSPLPGATSGLKYIHLMKNGKPHLLTGLTNNMGAETSVTYAPSTKFYFQDKFAGKPWVTKLPFPVHVVERVETIDHIGENWLVTRYAYHHGYFDGKEREFRGFGMVETIDTETFEEYEGDGEHYVAPILTRTWFHTGAQTHESVISKQFAREYWNGDSSAFELPDTVLPPLAPEERHEALRALRGSELRKEVYELGNDVPYQVIETNQTVRQLQPKLDNKHAVYFTHAHESITFHYEQNSFDPRIGQEYVLEVDEFGNVTKSASLVYPRRSSSPSNPFAEQERPYMTARSDGFINTTTDSFYLTGVPYESKSFEIGGDLPVTSDSPFDFETASAHVADALSNVIACHQTFDPDRKQARLLSWTRRYFWNGSQTAALPLGGVTERALLHHEESAVFTPELIDAAYGADITDTDITGAGYTSAGGYWWNPGIIQSYQNGTFYLPVRTDDPLGGFYTIAYDSYNLSQISITDALSNTTSARIDYRTLQPGALTDPNGTVSEAITDPLGLVIATSVHGSEAGVSKGDSPLSGYGEIDNPSVSDIVSDSEKYLQDATTFFFYDLDAWKDRNDPPQFITLARETHVSDVPPGGATRIQISIGYSDGFAREIQSKIKVEPGIAWVRQSDDSYAEEQVTDRWLVSGRTVYNNKQKPVKQYEPFYGATYEYEPEEFFARYGVTPIIHYDPLLRVVRTDTPKGFFTKVEFTPWRVLRYDENDTVKDSDYYAKMATLPASEQEALRKAEAHYNTPSVQILDTLGRAYRSIEYTLDIDSIDDGNRAEHEFVTYTEFNITGKPLSVTDPRQYDAAGGVKNFRYTYAMDESVMRTVSVDAGDDRVFGNVVGNPVASFDARGHRIDVEYDLLHRPTLTRVTGNGLNNVTERLVYGESQTDPEVNNLRGRVYRHFDQAGSVTFHSYSFKGEPIRSEQHIRLEYKLEADWADGADWDSLLEPESFETITEFDALGRLREQDSPDGSRTRPEYHLSGKLNKVQVRLKNETDYTEFVRSIRYNPKGQREKIVYGNSTETAYSYERETFRLTGLTTTRTSDSRDLQDITYTYDPVGNITEIIDESHHRVFNAGHIIDPENTFVYDALYRLLEAHGREHLALLNPLHSNFDKFKQSLFTHINDSQNLGLYTQYYTYDKAGNLTQIQHTGTGNSSRNFTRTMVVAPASNRAIPDSMGSDVAACFDRNGNMTSLEHLAGIAWNYRDNIFKATIIDRPDGETDDAEYYVYNSAGQRVRKVKETLVSGAVEIEEKIYLGGVELKRIKTAAGSLTLERSDLHVMDDTSRIAIVNYWTVDIYNREVNSSADLNTNKIRYQYGNHLGSASLELDDSGRIISYEEYFPYGGTSFVTGDNQKEVKLKEYRYTGKERDDFTGLYYYGARYYAPWIARWLSCDPGGPNDGLNLYAYVKNNPVRFTDPDGKASVESDATHVKLPYIAPEAPKVPQLFPTQRVSTGPELREHRAPDPQSTAVAKQISEYNRALAEGLIRTMVDPFFALGSTPTMLATKDPGLSITIGAGTSLILSMAGGTGVGFRGVGSEALVRQAMPNPFAPNFSAQPIGARQETKVTEMKPPIPKNLVLLPRTDVKQEIKYGIQNRSVLMLKSPEPVLIEFPAKGLTPTQQKAFSEHLAEQEAALNKMPPEVLSMNLINYRYLKESGALAKSRVLAGEYLGERPTDYQAAHRLDTRAGGYINDFTGFRDPTQALIGSLWRTRWQQIEPGRTHKLVPVFR